MGNVTFVSPDSRPKPSGKGTVRGTYFIQTWGCQMNEEDSEQMALYLRDMGFQPAVSWRDAEVVLLNTCSVRRKPEDKALSFLGELVPIKEARPNMIIGVAGCMAQIKADFIRQRNPHVDFVIGTAQVSKIPEMVDAALHTKRFQKRMDLPERKGAVVTDIPQRNLERSRWLASCQQTQARRSFPRTHRRSPSMSG